MLNDWAHYFLIFGDVCVVKCACWILQAPGLFDVLYGNSYVLLLESSCVRLLSVCVFWCDTLAVPCEPTYVRDTLPVLFNTENAQSQEIWMNFFKFTLTPFPVESLIFVQPELLRQGCTNVVSVLCLRAGRCETRERLPKHAVLCIRLRNQVFVILPADSFVTLWTDIIIGLEGRKDAKCFVLWVSE